LHLLFYRSPEELIGSGACSVCLFVWANALFVPSFVRFVRGLCWNVLNLFFFFFF
jgi:hypothetical protein